MPDLFIRVLLMRAALGHIHWAARIDRADRWLLGCYPGAIRGLNSGAEGHIGVMLTNVSKRRITQGAYIGTPNGFVPGAVAFAGRTEEQLLEA
ncbi:MAG TPA: hypothetical protein VD902_03420 [Symbiobacteriaceae bacterium]|nr:hypothetical protein [Symbiobacteriaceae bacterium]